MHDRLRALAFDLDAASLTSLREALPDWEVEAIPGATAASIPHQWNPGEVNLLVVQVRQPARQTMALCRVLTRRGVFSQHTGQEVASVLGPPGSLQSQAQRAHAPLLVLVSPGEDALVVAALEAGAHSCLLLPIHPNGVVTMLDHVRTGNQPGRHTLNLETAQGEDRWRDVGGQG